MAPPEAGQIMMIVAEMADLHVDDRSQHRPVGEKLATIARHEGDILQILRQVLPLSVEPNCFVVRQRGVDRVACGAGRVARGRAREGAIERDGVRVVLIDPWNELDRARPRDTTMTDYIGECLMMLKDFCRTFQVSVIVVAHPTKAVNEHGGRMPGLADIEGSMNWFNKCDNGLILHRDPEKNTCQVISAKVRENGAGKRGSAFFWVDPETGIYTPQTGAVLP